MATLQYALPLGWNFNGLVDGLICAMGLAGKLTHMS